MTRILSTTSILLFMSVLFMAESILTTRERLLLLFVDMGQCRAMAPLVRSIPSLIDAPPSDCILLVRSQLRNYIVQPLNALVLLVNSLFYGFLVLDELLLMLDLEFLKSLLIESLDFVHLLLSELTI